MQLNLTIFNYNTSSQVLSTNIMYPGRTTNDFGERKRTCLEKRSKQPTMRDDTRDFLSTAATGRIRRVLVWCRNLRAQPQAEYLQALRNTKEKPLRFLYRNGLKVSRGLCDILIEKRVRLTEIFEK